MGIAVRLVSPRGNELHGDQSHADRRDPKPRAPVDWPAGCFTLDQSGVSQRQVSNVRPAASLTKGTELSAGKKGQVADQRRIKKRSLAVSQRVWAN